MDFTYLPREVESLILERWEAKRFFVIRGPRRSGKTTFLKHLNRIKGGTYITLESPSMREQFLRDPLSFVEALEAPIFLDEVQYTGERGAQALKLIYDESDKKLVISGSGAFDVRMKLLAYLVGRTFIYDLLPLSFSEVAAWKGAPHRAFYERGNHRFRALLEGREETLPEPSPLLEELFNHYTIWGGYPEVVLGGGKEELEAIVTTTIEEDVIRYFSLRAHSKMWGFVRKLAALAGRIVSLSTFGVSYKTAEEYLAILERSFIVKPVHTFATNKLVELTKAKKVYFYDNGFRNALLGTYSPMGEGFVLENAVFRQLLKYGEVLYWRTRSKAEVDFVVRREGEVVPVEVKAGEGRLTRSLKAFIERYHPPVAIVISRDVWEKQLGDTVVYGIPPYYL